MQLSAIQENGNYFNCDQLSKEMTRKQGSSTNKHGHRILQSGCLFYHTILPTSTKKNVTRELDTGGLLCQLSQAIYYEDMNLPNKIFKTFSIVPIISIHKMAHTTPRTDKKRNPPVLLTLLLLSTVIPPVPAPESMASIFTLPKLDIRSNARFISTFSDANAGRAGTDPRKFEIAEENQESMSPYPFSSPRLVELRMQTISASSFSNSPTSPYRAVWPHLNLRPFSFQRKHNRIHSSMDVSSYIVKEKNTHDGREDLSRRCLLFLLSSGLFASYSTSAKAKSKSPYDERRLLEQNKRIQEANNAPKDFPNFIREGFEVKVVTPDSFVKCDSGLIYLDIQAGKGDCPRDGQQVTFHYIGYNESGRRIDSSYSQGTPAKIRMGTNSLVPGFEEGIKDMRPGGKRRIIIPPELGPPVGPSTFFSSKQFEVFDVELLNIQNCERRTILAFYSDVVCN